VSGVPTLDIGRFDPARPDTDFVAALREAFRDTGFVTLVGHGIDARTTAPVYAAMARTFALPAAVKARYVVAGSGGARGYTAFGVEKARDQQVPDLKEFWHVGRPEDTESPNVWPSEVPELAPACSHLFYALESLGKRVLAAIALGLGLDARYFEPLVDHGASILRPLHYPPLSSASSASSAPAAGGVRSAAHEDINLITLLVGADAPGLEVLLRDGRYLPIHVEDGAIVVNVGDMLQRLTNHALVSTTHRVVNPPAPLSERPRFSVPFFLHFNPEVQIVTLPGCIGPDRPNRYPEPITARAYLEQRLREIGLL
jgi:isopenicillin N synthase-like dioxygenase